MTGKFRTAVRAGRSTLSEAVAGEIEQMILEGELTAGERLPTELDLSEELEVSRSVVRDAIRTLSARGLIQVQQGIGMVVASPTDTAFSDAMIALLMRSELTMGDVTEARAVIETQCAVLAAERGTAEDFEQLQHYLEAFRAATATGDLKAIRESHFAFHRGILKAVHLPALEMLLRPVQRVILITALPPMGSDPANWEFDCHPPILEAIRKRDPEAVRLAMDAHFASVQDYEEFRETPFRRAAKLEEWLGLRDSKSARTPSRTLRKLHPATD